MTDAAALQAQMAVFLRRPRDLAHDPEARRFAEEHLGQNPRLSAVEQLEIYREQFYLRHTASLVEDFPGLGGILGQAAWNRLVWDYLASIAPTSFDLGDLGAGLADFIATRDWPEQKELLVDMARLEYSHLEVFDAPDAGRLDPAKLAAVPEEAWEHARLVPDSGLRLLDLRYPVLALRRGLIQKSEDESLPPVPLPAAKTGYLAVHRRERAIYHDELEPKAYALLTALARGEPLGRACESAAAAAGVTAEELGASLTEWFTAWSAQGYFADVVVADAP